MDQLTQERYGQTDARREAHARPNPLPTPATPKRTAGPALAAIWEARRQALDDALRR